MDGSEEGIRAVEVRPGPEESFPIEQRRPEKWGDPDELGVIRLEGMDHVLVFLAAESAGRIDEAASRPQVLQASLEQAALQRGVRSERHGVQSPSQIGAAAERSQL